MRFFLGVHRAYWLHDPRVEGIPLFLSHNVLRDRRKLTPAVTDWALDSGGFTQLSRNPDGWAAGSEEPYVEAVYRYRDGIGRLQFASPQDWMCEPWLIRHRSVQEHQERTVENFLRLRELAPDLPWAPVLQGWALDDYHFCADLYRVAGVDLTAEPIVGIGSVCRRQATSEIEAILQSFAGSGIAIHGFGVKTTGLRRYGELLASADSMAWSAHARYPGNSPDAEAHGHANCANCLDFALQWRERVLAAIPA